MHRLIAKMQAAHFFTTTALSLFLCLASWTVDGREVVVASTVPSCSEKYDIQQQKLFQEAFEIIYKTT